MSTRESDLEARLVKGVAALGGRAYKFVSPGNTGVPDRLVVLPGGRVFFVELKTDAGSLSPRQKLQIERLVRQGADVTVARGSAGVDRCLDRFRREARGREV